MRTVSVRELQGSIKQCVEYSQRDRVVITQHGEPSAVIIGVKGMDWELVVMETSAPFWKMIRKRRAQPTLSLAETRSRVSAGRRKNGKTSCGPKLKQDILAFRPQRNSAPFCSSVVAYYHFVFAQESSCS